MGDSGYGTTAAAPAGALVRAIRRPVWRGRRLLLVLAAAYLIGLHAMVGVLVLKTDFLDRVENRLNILYSGHGKEFAATYWRWAETLARSDERARPGSLLFLGDSVLRDLDTSSIARHTLNMGIPGDTTAGVLERARTYHTIETARGVVLHFGLNDLPRRPVDEALGNYGRVLDLIPATTPILVVAVLPVDERARRIHSNATIRAMNEGLAGLCGARPNCRFVDPTPRLVDGAGNLAAGMHDGDGIHLSVTGHGIFWSVMNAAIFASMPPAMPIAPAR
jgi:lysophospholipase L1-like esterase